MRSNWPLDSADSVSEAAHGTKGTSQVNAYRINKENVGVRGERNPYEQEHTDLIDAIRNGKTINELKTVAESTLTAIMGREAAYTGKTIVWDEFLKSPMDLVPENLELNAPPPEAKIPVPGKL